MADDRPPPTDADMRHAATAYWSDDAIPPNHPARREAEARWERWIKQHDAAVVAALDLPTIIAEALPCTWSIAEQDHPYAANCHHKRHGEGYGACWDRPHAVAAAIRAAVKPQG